MTKLLTTIVGVAIAVGVFTAGWVALNLLFSQTSKNFERFSAILGAVIGAVAFAIVDGNRLITGATTRPDTLFNGDEDGLFTNGLVDGLILGHLFWPAVGAVVGGAALFVLSKLDDQRQRLGFGIALGVGLGLLFGFLLKTRYELALRTVPLFTWPIVLAAIGIALAKFRNRSMLGAGLAWGAIGLAAGTFGSAVMGNPAVSNQAETLLATCGIGGLLGARLGLTPNPDVTGRAEIDNRSRAFLFVGPAVFFIMAALIVPVFATLALSFNGRDGTENVGWENYRNVFTDDNNFDSSRWGDIWGSDLIIWGAIFLAIGVLLAILLGRETGQAINVSGAPLVPLILGGVILSFAVFTHLRGTIINNIWWVVAVTTLSTALGLAIAKIADNRPGESIAKSMVFMPLAISMVGASIIWRLMMYQARNITKEQTGLFNAIWVWLGRVTEGGVGQWLIALFFAGTVLWLLYIAYRSLGNSLALSGMYVAIAIIPAWVAMRTLTTGIGGFQTGPNGEFLAQPVQFVQDTPYNNFFLMLIMVWMQTGFAMVILSAAIKAVPDDFLEAARMDGADESQIFWRITVPQIAPTITVVATTIMVNVMKVFDFVKVTTNGQFDTQVLANAMFQEAFLNFDRGLGAALAIVLFVGILPVVVLNLTRLIREA